MRTVRESDFARRQFEKLAGADPNYRQHYDYVLHRLAVHPDLAAFGMCVKSDGDNSIYSAETAAMQPLGVPRMKLMYQFDRQSVTILALAAYLPQ